MSEKQMEEQPVEGKGQTGTSDKLHQEAYGPPRTGQRPGPNGDAEPAGRSAGSRGDNSAPETRNKPAGPNLLEIPRL